MKITQSSENIKSLKTDLIVIPVFEKETKNEHLKNLGDEFLTELSRAIKSKVFLGEFLQVYKIATLGKISASNIVIIGLGKKKDLTIENLRRASSYVHKIAKALRAKKYVSLLSTIHKEKGIVFNVENSIMAISESIGLSDYSFDKYKTQGREKLFSVSEVQLFIDKKKSFTSIIKKANIIANSTNYVRDLVNLPPNVVYPDYLAKEAKKLHGNGCKVTILDKKTLQKGGFGGILAVGGGSYREPRLVVIDYNPSSSQSLSKNSKKKTIALVGKGITFDSGGLNIKPGAYMETMKCDMAGAGAVLGALKAAKAFNLKHRIIGILCCAENMPSGISYRPDDILKMYNGKTVEVGNTDAEGRLVLADGLAYAEKKYKPDQIIDLATLTGACVVALGYWATGMMTTEDKMAKLLEESGIATGDRVWRLPLWEEYKEYMKSSVADVRNISSGRDSGTITAAIFLQHFVEKTPWVHLDIAGTAFLKEGKYYNPKNATGAGVRLLLNYLERV
jgi:leucyl aminopeptidase